MFNKELFGQRVIENRKSIGLLAKELSIQVDITATHLSDIENGKVKPSIKVLINILNVFNKTYAQFMENNQMDTKRSFYEKEIASKIATLSDSEVDFFIRLVKRIKKYGETL